VILKFRNFLGFRIAGALNWSVDFARIHQRRSIAFSGAKGQLLKKLQYRKMPLSSGINL
jgi:hypothetical protein